MFGRLRRKEDSYPYVGPGRCLCDRGPERYFRFEDNETVIVRIWRRSGWFHPGCKGVIQEE